VVRQNAKKSANSGTVTTPCIHLSQGTHGFYLTKLKASVLAKISYASVRRLHTEEGAVQRILDQRRIVEIKKFALDAPHFPSCIILNWTDNDSLRIEQDELSFKPAERQAQQVDGQHRVEGLREAIKDKPELGDLEIPVAIYVGLNTQECADLFLSINAKQRPVARTLVTDLFSVASSNLVDPGAARARDIAESLDTDPDSPYFNLVRGPNTPRGTMGVPISTVVDNLKPIVQQGGILVSAGLAELKMQTNSIKNYFQVLKNWYGLHWTDKSNPFLHASGFVGALGFFTQTVIPFCNLTRDYTTEHIADAMELDPSVLITRDELKGKQGRASWNEVTNLLKERWKASEFDSQEIKL
jgi:DGQHR domain-containing protein